MHLGENHSPPRNQRVRASEIPIKPSAKVFWRSRARHALPIDHLKYEDGIKSTIYYFVVFYTCCFCRPKDCSDDVAVGSDPIKAVACLPLSFSLSRRACNFLFFSNRSPLMRSVAFDPMASHETPPTVHAVRES